MTLHDKLISRLIVESIARNGAVTLEEAKFFNDFSGRILSKIVEESQEFDYNYDYAQDYDYAQSNQNVINESSTASIVRKLIK